MDIWTILEYTASVTVIGLLIWLIKLIFHDKLDARWHYFIWLVLLVRIIVPVSARPVPTPFSVFDEIPIGKWIEMGRILAEKKGYGELSAIAGRVYLWGAVMLGGFYLAMWAILRIQVAMAPGADALKREQINEIASKYGLKSCRDIRIRRNAAPYVCGLLCPVLVLPEGGLPEESVIVHELLHKRYKDVLVNLGIHAVRVVNWFNPIVWLLTSVVLNDSEALCDQRVLERCGKENARHYGELLIGMSTAAGGGGKNTATIGTSNMAGSYRNMKTRIRRIRDFTRVPEKIGLVTLCITLMLAAAGTGSEAQGGYTLELPELTSEKDLERAMLYARCYHARTPEEAIYLFIRSYEQNDLIYRMSVMPEKEIPRYEEFARKWFLQKELTARAEVPPGEKGGFPCYFPEKIAGMEDYRVCNLLYDETEGTATVYAIPNAKRGEAFVEWKLSLTKEDGWKVWLTEESGMHSGEYIPESLLFGTARMGDFLVELSAYNEGYYDQLGALQTAGFLAFSQKEEESETCPTYFSAEYKYRCLYLTYLGEESLEGHAVKVTVGETDLDESREQPWTRAGAEPPVPEEKVRTLTYSYGDGNGNGRAAFDGAELMTGEPRLIYGVGDGYSEPGLCWKESDKIVSYVRIYVDDVLAEEGEIQSKNL